MLSVHLNATIPKLEGRRQDAICDTSERRGDIFKWHRHMSRNQHDAKLTTKGFCQVLK